MARAEYRKSNEFFKFHNENPKNRLTAQDCVIRALGYATKLGWDEVYKELSAIGFELKDALTSDRTVFHYLTNNGWKKMRQPKKEDGTKYQIKEFLAENNDKTMIIRVNGHVTVGEDGMVVDTWDCSEEYMGTYWIKE